MLPWLFADPTAPIGFRLNVAGPSHVALQCTMAQAADTCVGGTDAGLGCATDVDCAGGGTCSGGVSGVFVPVPDADLISIPIIS